VAQLPGWHVEQAPASQVPAPQPAQTAPPAPQAVPESPGMHWFPWQHPCVQLAASHTHAPPWQR
jgi:hypothetical protein